MGLPFCKVIKYCCNFIIARMKFNSNPATYKSDTIALPEVVYDGLYKDIPPKTSDSMIRVSAVMINKYHTVTAVGKEGTPILPDFRRGDQPTGGFDVKFTKSLPYSGLSLWEGTSFLPLRPPDHSRHFCGPMEFRRNNHKRGTHRRCHPRPQRPVRPQFFPFH